MLSPEKDIVVFLKSCMISSFDATFDKSLLLSISRGPDLESIDGQTPEKNSRNSHSSSSFSTEFVAGCKVYRCIIFKLLLESTACGVTVAATGKFDRKSPFWLAARRADMRGLFKFECLRFIRDVRNFYSQLRQPCLYLICLDAVAEERESLTETCRYRQLVGGRQ